MIEDLMQVALRLVTEKEKARLIPIIQQTVEEKLLNLLIGIKLFVFDFFIVLKFLLTWKGEANETTSVSFREDIRSCLKNLKLEVWRLIHRFIISLIVLICRKY
jgi:ATP-dependent protease HslVU (ClpYQ) ATPase subunit